MVPVLSIIPVLNSLVVVPSIASNTWVIVPALVMVSVLEISPPLKTVAPALTLRSPALLMTEFS